MKREMKKAICMAAIGALTLVSVIGDNVTSEAAAKTKKIVMNKTKVSLKVGKTFKLKVKKVKPAKASKKVTYKSSKKKVATVSAKGVIKAKSQGTAKITVTSKKNKKAKATVTVKVTKSTTPVNNNNNNNNSTAAPTATPVNASAAPSQVPSVSQPPVNTTTPTDVPSTTAPAATKPATQKPTTPPTPVKTPNIIDMDKYDINLKDALYANEWYERQDNADGSVTLTRGQGDADWQVGEFGFELPRDVVGDQHKFKSIRIKFKDSTLTDQTVEKGVCGYVFHSVAQWEEIDASGREDKVGWYDFVDNPKEAPHDAAIEFNGSGEVVITSDMDDFSTVRIYDGVIGGKITIESISVEKGDTPPVVTPPADTSNVDTSNVDTSAVEKPKETGKPSTQPVMINLSDVNTYVCDGAGVKPSYDSAKGALAVVVPQFQGIILKVPDDGKTYKSMKVTYTSDSKLNAYLFDGEMTDGKGQTPDGQHEVTGGLEAAAEEKTVEFKVAAGYVGDCLKAIKFVHVDFDNNAAKNISIKSIELS